MNISLFYSPQFRDLAHNLIEENKKSENKKLNFEEEIINFDTFRDGFPNLFIENIKSVKNQHVVFLASFENQSDILSQLAVIYALPRYLAKSLVIVLPYFPTGTMERVDNEGQIATAMTLARMLSATPLGACGPTRLLILDIHALQERFYFSDSIVPVLDSCISSFKEILKKNHDSNSISIAFPDDGAAKRFGSMFSEYPIIICSKVRGPNDQRIVTIKEGNPKDSHVFIVDDLVQTGGTLIECCSALKEAGSNNVSAFVTHPIFPNQSWTKFSNPESLDKTFEHFYTTDSCPIMAQTLKDKKPFTVISIAKTLSQSLQNLY